MRCAACLQLLQHHSAAQRGALAILGGQRAPVHPVPSPTRGTRALSSSPPLQHAVPATAGPHTRNAAAAAHASLSSAAPQLTVGPPAQQQPRPRSAALPRAQQHQPYLAARSLAAGAMARNSSNAAAEASPRPRPAIQRLHRAAERHLVGRRGQPPSPEQLHELRQLAAAVTLPELGFSEDLLQDPSKLEQSLRQQEKLFSKSHPFLRGSVTYLHIHSCSDYSLGIFMIPQGSSIPLHDHPGMTVISHLLFGSLGVRAFDLLPPPPPSSHSNGSGQARSHPPSPPSWQDAPPVLSTSDPTSPPLSEQQQQQRLREQQQGAVPVAASSSAPDGKAGGGGNWAAQVAASISSQLLGSFSQGGGGGGSSAAAAGGAAAAAAQEAARRGGKGHRAGWAGLAMWAGDVEEDEGRLLPARLVVDDVVTAPCAPMTVHPEQGNIHEFAALTHCAVLDLLTPPYNELDGRDCTYFGEVEVEVASPGDGAEEGVGAGGAQGAAASPRVGDEVYLEVVRSDFYTKSAPYTGVRVA